MNLDERIETISRAHYRFTMNQAQKDEIKQLIRDVLEYVKPEPSLRAAKELGPDTVNKDFQRGNFKGYNEAYSEMEAKIKELGL